MVNTDTNNNVTVTQAMIDTAVRHLEQCADVYLIEAARIEDRYTEDCGYENDPQWLELQLKSNNIFSAVDSLQDPRERFAYRGAL